MNYCLTHVGNKCPVPFVPIIVAMPTVVANTKLLTILKFKI